METKQSTLENTMTGNKVNSDEHSDYQLIKQQAAQRMQEGVWIDRFPTRFVPFSTREMRCDLPQQAIANISDGKHYTSYRGLPMAKDPFDLNLYEMLLFELKPRTIIELGAYTGASALWLHDRMSTFGLETQIVSVDIDLALVDSQVRKTANIEFYEGDCNQIEELFPAPELARFAKPLVLIDDAHVNIDGVYRHFHQHGFASGDYLIVEDTIPWIPGTFGKSESNEEWGDWKWREISTFFHEFDEDYAVDRYYTDFFGYNATWNWNGFIKRK